MASPIYGFILNMWMMKKMDAEKVHSYSPRYLTQGEVDMILATPQYEDYQSQSTPTQST